MYVIDHGPCPKCNAPNHYLEPVGSPAPTWLLRCEGCGTSTAFPEEVVVEWIAHHMCPNREEQAEMAIAEIKRMAP